MGKRKFISKRSRKKKYLFLSLLLCLFLLGIGYANLETLLSINGTVNVSEYSSFSYTINYNYNNGQGLSTNPVSSTANGVVEIPKPTKSIVLTFDSNSQGASIKDENQDDISNTNIDLVFEGWTATGVDTTIAKYGFSRDSITTLWSDLSTPVGGDNAVTYFRSLSSTDSAITLIANWEEEIITLPTLAKEGYICSFNTLSDGTGTSYQSGGSYVITNESPNTLYVRCLDNAAPIITSITASSSLGYSNYVDFTATDAESGIAGYNISSDGINAPTAWIPVVSTVEATTETKYELGASWARIFHHNNHQGSIFFEDDTKALSSNEVDKYSVLGNIANYKSTNYEFLLQYPDLSATLYNRWIQTDNPVTTIIADGDGSEFAGGYVGSHIDWNGNYWGGLTKSSSTATLLNGSVGHGNWFYAIGANTSWSGSMPGPNSTPVGMANLWARIDTLTASTSNNLTRRIGDIRSDGTYYVWVKDNEGNTNKQSVSITNTDTAVPTASITSTNNVAASQTVTLTMGDNKGLDKYYFGTTNPASAAVTYTAITGTSKTQTTTVSNGGTYYLAVVDKAGNRTIVNKVFYKTTLTPNRGSVNPSTVVTMSGNGFTIPTPGAVSNYTWGGWYKDSSLSTSAGTSYTPTSSITLYGKWTMNPCLSFENDSWATVVSCVQSGNYGNYTVGSTKDIPIFNTVRSLRIINNSNYGCNYSSKTGCGFILEFTAVTGGSNMNSTSTNSGGWGGSEARTYLNSTFLNAMPAELRNAIIDTTVVYGNPKTIQTSTDKLYFLSTLEVNAQQSNDAINSSHTRVLDYYIGADRYKRAKNAHYWLRSAHNNTTTSFYRVTHDWDGNHDSLMGAVNYVGAYRSNADTQPAPAFRLRG